MSKPLNSIGCHGDRKAIFEKIIQTFIPQTPQGG